MGLPLFPDVVLINWSGENKTWTVWFFSLSCCLPLCCAEGRRKQDAKVLSVMESNSLSHKISVSANAGIVGGLSTVI
jgi:hypothetical protein